MLDIHQKTKHHSTQYAMYWANGKFTTEMLERSPSLHQLFKTERSWQQKLVFSCCFFLFVFLKQFFSFSEFVFIKRLINTFFFNINWLLIVLFKNGLKFSLSSGVKARMGEQVFKAPVDPFSHHEMSSFSKPGRQASDFWHNLQWPSEGIGARKALYRDHQNKQKANQKYVVYWIVQKNSY